MLTKKGIMSRETAPTVSVIVPNYNHARYLRKRIESVLGQTYQDFEVILLDDCSTDVSREVLASYQDNPRVRVEYNAENSGSVFKQWNKGVRMARGRYIWIAESDDYADACFLARMVPLLEEQTEVTFAYCRSRRVGEDDEHFGFADSDFDRLDPNHWASDFVVDGPEEYRRFFVLTNPVPNASAVLFRKHVYERVGWAEERYRICGDYQVWAAMALEGKVAYVGEPLNHFRTHRENVRAKTRAGALDIAEYFYAMLSILHRVGPPATPIEERSIDEIFSRSLFDLSPHERIKTAKQALSYIADWNLRHNPYVSVNVMQEYFRDWDFALIGREFAISPPSRWQFFLHRCRFYRHYFTGMGWKMRLVNLMRVLGAPVVGYQHRHWPEETLARFLRVVDTT
jgi:glycosyltransferase involved in cell wall biosynthesis